MIIQSQSFDSVRHMLSNNIKDSHGASDSLLCIIILCIIILLCIVITYIGDNCCKSSLYLNLCLIRSLLTVILILLWFLKRTIYTPRSDDY